jgi:hypothetical protein
LLSVQESRFHFHGSLAFLCYLCFIRWFVWQKILIIINRLKCKSHQFQFWYLKFKTIYFSPLYLGLFALSPLNAKLLTKLSKRRTSSPSLFYFFFDFSLLFLSFSPILLSRFGGSIVLHPSSLSLTHSNNFGSYFNNG